MDGMNGKISENKWATTSSIHILLTSSFDASSSEQMKNREKWRQIIQEAKAHRAVAPRGRNVSILYRYESTFCVGIVFTI
jgi:hypothetical protein